MDSNKRYLTAEEAAEALNISRATLYAYVSRGLIRSEETPGKSRAKRYRGEDVAALQARKALRRDPAQAAAQALHFGQPVLDSALTLIENGRFFYRGRDAVELSRTHTFEQVVSLLWGAKVDFSTQGLPGWTMVQPLQPQLAALTPVEAFQVVLPLAAAQDLAAYQLEKTAVAACGGRILRLITAVAAGQPPQRSLAGALQQAWAPTEKAVADLIDAALILCADHELNVSAFAARAVASAQATPYGVVMAGLAALQGRRHGGMTEQAAAFLQEVAAPERALTVIAQRLKRGESVPGFGHPLYPQGDPRARELVARVTAVFPNAPETRLMQRVVAAMAETVGTQPTIDLALAGLGLVAGLPPGAPLALFAIGRTAGWIGHGLEQYGADELIRPRARYVGPSPRG